MADSRGRELWVSSILTPMMAAVGKGCCGVLLEASKRKALILTAMCTPEITTPPLNHLMARALDHFGVTLLSPPKVLLFERAAESPVIITVAQFQPEKAHTLQLEAFSAAIKRLDPSLPKPKFQLVGSYRNKSDEDRLQMLKNKAIELVNEHVEFHKNVTYRDLVGLLGGAVAGIHSMTDEHFGISVVEYIAAGVIPIAHNSTGPKMDIVLDEDGQQTGFLACTVEEYADAMVRIITMSKTERLKMAAAARRRASRFSEQRFYDDFKAAVRPILCHISR